MDVICTLTSVETSFYTKHLCNKKPNHGIQTNPIVTVRTSNFKRYLIRGTKVLNEQIKTNLYRSSVVFFHSFSNWNSFTQKVISTNSMIWKHKWLEKTLKKRFKNETFAELKMLINKQKELPNGFLLCTYLYNYNSQMLILSAFIVCCSSSNDSS